MRGWSRTAVVALTVTLTVAASAVGVTAEPQPSVPPTTSNSSAPAVGGNGSRVEPDGRVDTRKLPRPGRGAGQEPKRFLPAPQFRRAEHRAPSTPVTTSGVVPKAAPSPVSPKAVPASAVLERLKTFTTLGNVDSRIPSDTQIAVGPWHVIQMINRSGQIYDKAGNAQGGPFDLGAFFGFAANSGTDPRVHYDAGVGRFYACYESNVAGGDEIQLAVSDDDDPNGNWTRYNVGSNNTNIQHDQPKLGYSNNKVTLSWNNYDKAHTGDPDNGFRGVVTVVVNKAQLVAQGVVDLTTFAADTGKFQVVPAVSLSGIDNQLAMWHGENSTEVRVVTITGVPGVPSQPVAQTENTLSIGADAPPPDGVQPSGGAAIETNDSRMLSVAWQNNRLWGVFNVSCTPPGDSTVRACQRYLQVSTGGTQTLTTNHNLGLVGGDIYYGSLVMNDEDDLFSGFTASSSSIFPTAVAIGVPGGNFPAVLTGDFYAAGTQVYTAGARWGDYSGTARDPGNPKDVWTSQQIGGLAGGDWGSATDRVTLSPPVVTGVEPNHAPELTSCVSNVTVRGREFPTSETTVKFGSVTASNVNVIGPEELTVDVPPLSRRTVDVTVTTPNGTSPVTDADKFTFDADTVDPTVEATISPAANSAGWYTTSPTTVSITASDGACGSGVSHINVSVNGDATHRLPNATALTLTQQGENVVVFSATDNAGNTSSAHSVTVRLDSVAPSIGITSPTAGPYLLDQPVNALYSCSDATSGVATCAGPVPSGSPVDTSTVGPHTFTVNATDRATNPASKSVTYTVAYRICLLYDPLNPPRGGNSTIPIRLRLCDANGVNLSSPDITLTPSAIAGPTAVPFTTPFRYDARLRGYIVNVPTRGLPAGSYNLRFTISGADSTTHVAPFTVR
ncbi:OmpL47-type beta-barrel domain-containing protein [Streptomyces sp. NPDC059874]|uniref:OmpL47-type beta-barrel domain-containing protein n=1 Tax=Streptomyces sp. NPDC059874 TaxID=3346983 RepID=UPI0036538E73